MLVSKEFIQKAIKEKYKVYINNMPCIEIKKIRCKKVSFNNKDIIIEV